MKKFNLSIFAIVFIAAFIFQSCSDSPVQNTESRQLLFNHDGLIEEVGGDCSAVQVRTRSFGEFDLSGYSKLRFEFDGMSDADLSSISIFYYENGEIVNFVNLTNRDEINSTDFAEVNSPGMQREIFSRVTLKSSVCTGQIFYLTFRDLKIFGIRQ
ncbi:MAG TPA: hypothetical protein PK536_00885 [Ignavibacteria bacterium]|nr:hypothetical protein [Bacteroidota bacterium]HRI83979.1 hypothetical protein [Ignavibacteria bacterium]HRJ99176.1 hypothetical protein [Ignavibacteria bacterium]